MSCWFDGIASLADMEARRSEFLSAPGTHPDMDAILQILDSDGAAGDAGSLSDDAALALWFDRLVARFRENGPILAVYRQMGLDDPAAFLDAVRAGAPVGSHWSLDPGIDISGHHEGRETVLLVGRVRETDVCWFTTFQANFSHPWEAEVAVDGTVMVDRMGLGDGTVHVVGIEAPASAGGPDPFRTP
jgi:hypothetical protein